MYYHFSIIVFLQEFFIYSPLVHVYIRARRSGFTTLSPVLLQEQSAVVFLLERALVSWSLAMDERGGHEDLRGSGHRSVIPYVHGRTELYCSSLSYLSLPICPPTPVKRRLPEPFIAQGRAVILRPRA
jgi:hypothetical protein